MRWGAPACRTQDGQRAASVSRARLQPPVGPHRPHACAPQEAAGMLAVAAAPAQGGARPGRGRALRARGRAAGAGGGRGAAGARRRRRRLADRRRGAARAGAGVAGLGGVRPTPAPSVPSHRPRLCRSNSRRAVRQPAAPAEAGRRPCSLSGRMTLAPVVPRLVALPCTHGGARADCERRGSSVAAASCRQAARGPVPHP